MVVTAAWLAQHMRTFFSPVFWRCPASLAKSAHHCSTLQSLFVSVWLYVPGTRRKLHPCPPDFPPATQHAAQWTLRSQERVCSFCDSTSFAVFRHVFRPTFAIFGVTERTHIRSPAILNVYFTDCYCDCLLLYQGNHIILRYIAHITAANQADGQLLILFEKHIGPYVQHMHSTSVFSQNRILLDLHTKKQRR